MAGGQGARGHHDRKKHRQWSRIVAEVYPRQKSRIPNRVRHEPRSVLLESIAYKGYPYGEGLSLLLLAIAI